MAAGPNDIRAGGTYFEAYVKDGVGPQLDKMKAKATGFSKWLQGVGQSVSGSLLFGGAAGMGVAFGQKVLGAAMDNLKEGIEEAIFSTQRLDAASKAMAENYAKAAESVGGFTARLKESLTGDPSAHWKKAADALKGLEAKHTHYAMKVLEHESKAGDRGSWAWLGFGDDERKRAADEMRAAASARDATMAEIERMRALKEELSRGERSAVGKFSLKPEMDALFTEVMDATDATLQRMGKFERQVYEFRRRIASEGRTDLPKEFYTDLDELERRAKWTDAELANPYTGKGVSGLSIPLMAGMMAGAAALKLEGADLTAQRLRGGFGADRALGRFGYGDQTSRDLLKASQETAVNTEKLVEAITNLWKVE